MKPCVVTFLYDGHAPEPYTVDQVNVLKRMVDRNTTIDHDFVVFTDYQRTGFDFGVFQKPMLEPWRSMERCLPRMQMFDDLDFQFYASRVVQIDLDCVITGNIDFVFRKHAKSKIAFWKDALSTKGQREFLYNGSLVSFDPRSNKNLAEPPTMSDISKHGFAGSDQAWFRIELGDQMPVFDADDGVYSFKFDGLRRERILPQDATIVFFHGQPKPWDIKLDWIEGNYR